MSDKDASQLVTDEALDEAYESSRAAEKEVSEVETEVEEEEIDEEPKENTVKDSADDEEKNIPEEPILKSERTKLGRKVKKLEDQLKSERERNEETTRQFNEAITRLNQILGTKEVDTEEEDFFMPDSKEELHKLFEKWRNDEENKRNDKILEASKKYSSDYISTIQDLVAEEDEDIQDEIIEMLKTDKFNVKYSDNGIRDAARNVKNVLKSLYSNKKNLPGKREVPRAPLGGGAGSMSPDKTTKHLKLSKEAEEFIAATGMSEESVHEALSGEAPAWVRG